MPRNLIYHPGTFPVKVATFSHKPSFLFPFLFFFAHQRRLPASSRLLIFADITESYYIVIIIFSLCVSSYGFFSSDGPLPFSRCFSGCNYRANNNNNNIPDKTNIWPIISAFSSIWCLFLRHLRFQTGLLWLIIITQSQSQWQRIFSRIAYSSFSPSSVWDVVPLEVLSVTSWPRPRKTTTNESLGVGRGRRNRRCKSVARRKRFKLLPL